MLIGTTAMVAAAAQAGGGSKDPLKLFEAMMPVLSHPRCSNCHGGVDVINGVNHDQLEKDDVPLNEDGDMLPGQDGNSKCLECHDENDKNSVWRLAPKSMAFAGKDSLSLCREIRDNNGLTSESSFPAFLNHLSGDQLIGFAFEGKRAMVDNDVQAPPMDRAAFINVTRRWLQEGKAKCSAWSGTINVTIDQTVPFTQHITVDVTVKDGDAVAVAHMVGEQHQTGQGCFTRDDTFKADDDGLPADVSILVNRDLGNVPDFPAVPGLPPGLPAAPGGIGGFGGVPGLPNLADNNGYSLVLRVPNVDGTNHFDEIDNPPACTHRSGDFKYSLTIPTVSLNKMLDPESPDHLQDTDVHAGAGGTITSKWDLSRE